MTDASEDLQGLLHREALRDLVALYAMAVDDHDLTALSAMFHPEAVFDRDGDVSRGWPEIAETLGASMRGFRRMLHTPHAVVVELTGSDSAVGISTGHAELVTRSGVLLAAYRYSDDFTLSDGRWLFARRAVAFVYAASAVEYATALPREERVCFPGEPERASRIRPHDNPQHQKEQG